MKTLCTAAQMRQAEANSGILSIHLMEKACRNILRALPMHSKVCFACGGGMNGGDGLGAAAMYAEQGGRAIVWLAVEADKLRGDARIMYNRCLNTGIRIVKTADLDEIPVPEFWVDALFGIGLSRPVEGVYAQCIERMNRDRTLGAKVVSVDIPSGIESDSGRILGCHVIADETITFGWPKPGHALLDGPEASGHVRVFDIGVQKVENMPRFAELKDAREFFPARARNTHKGTYGKLLIWAGSFGMAGAAALCAQAAMKSGAGLVSVACPEKIVPIVQTLAPCATCVSLPEDKAAAREVFQSALRGKNAFVAGPGLSKDADAELLREALLSGIPGVLDADALNLLAAKPELRALLKEHHVLTPHPGEAERLLGHACIAPIADAAELAKFGCIVLLKGATSVIAGKNITLSMTGTPAMAKGGSGDTLTGIIGALLARGISAEDAAWAGSEIHGTAGEIAAKKTGEYSLLATDLIACIGEAIGR